MKVGIEEIEVKEDTTIKALMDELQLSSVPILLEIGGEVFYPDEIKQDRDAWVTCIAGALEQQEYLRKIKKAGFEDVQVVSKREFYVEARESKAIEKLMSVMVEAHK